MSPLVPLALGVSHSLKKQVPHLWLDDAHLTVCEVRDLIALGESLSKDIFFQNRVILRRRKESLVRICSTSLEKQNKTCEVHY